MKQFLLNNLDFLTYYALEIIAAISGTIYLRKTKNEKLRLFVNYLWLIVAVELIGRYSYILQNNYDYEWYINLKNSVFCRNRWLYNLYGFLSIGLLGIFYSNLLTNKNFKILIRSIVIAYSAFSVFFYTFTDAFFYRTIPYDDVLGSIIICLFVVLYFIELIRSDYILVYNKLPSFYISVALLLWYLCATPLFIFDSYFYAINTKFVEFRSSFLLIINIFTYSCYTFGFWYSLKKSKQ